MQCKNHSFVANNLNLIEYNIVWHNAILISVYSLRD